jgi:hypothetical protein
MRRALPVLVLALLATGPAAAAAATTGRIEVLLAPGAHAAGALGAGARLDGPRVPQIRMITVRPAGGLSAAALLRRLRGRPDVASAVPERRFRLRDVPEDPALARAETARGTADSGGQRNRSRSAIFSLGLWKPRRLRGRSLSS